MMGGRGRPVVVEVEVEVEELRRGSCFGLDFDLGS